MRHTCFAILLICLSTFVSALEVEDHRLFPGTGGQTLKVISTADLEVFEPYLKAFQSQHPSLSIDYTVVSSSELHRAITGGAVFDLALSSAMDLQFQLANDGFAQSHQSEATVALPDWARWRDLIFAFTAEPAVVVLSTERFQGLELPTTRQELINVLREYPERFDGAVGTYDVRDSGLGYLFATQEARSTDAYWRLSEVMGRLNPQLYCCSGQMIDDVADGRLSLAYNVLGSYAAERLARNSEGRVQILGMQDFTNVILRTAIIPTTAQEKDAAGDLIDMLVRLGQRDAPEDWPLPPLGQSGRDTLAGFGPIRLGPALMVYLDPLNRRTFLAEWENALEQRQ
ncbi:extracellular solute-binding protein [Marivita sp. XM-24bin2]|jgi:iron(III) transport system substrate-binding protein|uniref:ABC transporter substrate-binding protein n=1 Tax=unclassified Marivita TaxID=2632480 RepID=UPI000D7A4E71|nr:extracellular solute-binding protein [Marivita sp. XM-24bin2]MCR9109110.1 extracellular solute-binding protein [Paracoccaceae bacterium]PWL36888.1 MAG: ABC transporter substrate-binding protein [Marivita sp. XM-24bin2]